ncbi:MAG: efflux transporter outer membrane subunit [Bryobacteraceae bacterium]
MPSIPRNNIGSHAAPRWRVALAAVLFLGSTACMVGPKYKRPSAPAPPAFKEPLPEGWKEAQPNDGAVRGKWWEIYNDPQLNALEEQVTITNQNVLAAEAQYRAARSAVGIARAALFPTVTAGPGITASRGPGGRGVSGAGTVGGAGVNTVYDLPFSVSYTADVWGSIRRSVQAQVATAQATFAQLENARLLYQSELAQDYFELLGTDAQRDLLERTVKSYQEFLTLTQNRYKAGVASGADVAQAETQLYTTRAQLIDLQIARAQFEHAIAVLAGRPPSEVTVPHNTIKTPPPPIPVSLPSTLLERRPDIAAAERDMAAVNEQVGIAQAAYYPTIGISASAGFTATSIVHWLEWPSRFFSIGPQLSQTLYEGGRRRSQVNQARALFDGTVATYRQTVLTAFQQVEDQLVSLRVLAEEAQATAQAVTAAEQSLQISTYQYKAGTVAYLQVLTAQAAALANERTAVDILTQRMLSSVVLIQALGGGWDNSTLPTSHEIIHGGQ